MTMDELRQAWAQSPMWGKNQTKEKEGSTHDKFRQEMAKKTVINRACKKFLNSSDDGSLVFESISRQDELQAESTAQAEVEANANKEELDFEDAEDVEFKEVDKNTGEIKEEQPKQKEPEQAELLEPTGSDGPAF